MHDLVHDLAVSLLGNGILDQSKQGNTKGSSCQYALLVDCSQPLELGVTSPASLRALRFLDCCGTELHGPAFAPATSLWVLDLSECSIQKLPDSLGELKQLRYLSTPGVQDRKLPECITKLSHLIYVDLHGFTIKKLPDSIGEMKGLMHLNLSGCNRIYGLPVSFWNLENLVHLELSDFGFSLFVSESMVRLSRLEHLSLADSRIYGDLTKALEGLTELQYLNLSNASCSGKLCIQKVLVNLSKLRYLNIQGVLQHNRVDKAECHTFLEFISSLSSLEYLNLARNHNLHSIPESIENLRKLHSPKFLSVNGCWRFDKSTLPQYKSSEIMLPHFVVHAGDDGESSSNLCQLEYENPAILEISRLENVKSAQEAQRIKLVEKHSIQDLQLVWTRDAKRFVDDKEVLEQLVPPYTVEKFTLKGYDSVSFPSWMTSIATYLPRLVEITLYHMPGCNRLPPLGQLPNLKGLDIGHLDSIRKIDQDLYGGLRAFPRLESFELFNMKCLEEWDTSYYPSPSGEDVSLPTIDSLSIQGCPKLRLKSCIPLVGKYMTVDGSDGVISSSWEYASASPSAATTWLCVKRCEAPLDQWSLLRHLPCLRDLWIAECSDLTCSSTDLLLCLASLEALSFRDCQSIAALPEWLGDLTSLKSQEA